MPVPFLMKGVFDGIGTVPYLWTVLKAVPWLLLVFVIRLYFGGVSNKAERLMHGKVVMMTGGTSGIGAAVAEELASRGAEIILLTMHPPSDPFLADYVNDLRERTGNELIYAEQVNLASLHSIRVFATKWIDNAPPRRLDMVILCAGVATPPLTKPMVTEDGLEVSWGVNYVANFHLLGILSPALRAQPPDRDVRIIVPSCSSYLAGQLDLNDTQFQKRSYPLRQPWKVYGAAKLALLIFARSFQKHLDAYQRPDKLPNNAKVIIVDPGWTRTPGTRRWLSMGSLWGLLGYMITWPLWWLLLKSPTQGAQVFLHAAMEANFQTEPGGKFMRECQETKIWRREIEDEKLAKELWEFTDRQIETLEKESAKTRAKDRTEKSKKAQEQQAADEAKPKENAPRKEGSRRSRKTA